MVGYVDPRCLEMCARIGPALIGRDDSHQELSKRYPLATDSVGANGMPTLVNVCGSGRSGTTMLDLMLGSSPNGFSCGEVYAWFRPWRTHHTRIVCSCKQNPCPVWEKIKGGPESCFHARVAESLKCDFVVDSSKEPCWLVDSQKWAVESGLEVVNVLLWKEPVDLAYSFWKRGRSINSWWKHFVVYHTRLLALNLPFVSVCFSNLVAEPEEQLRRLCEVIGMEYTAGQEEFWRYEHHHLFGSLGTRRQVDAQASQFANEPVRYPDEFARLIPEFLDRVQDDSRATDILSVLRRRDVMRVQVDRGPDQSRFVPPIIHPLWYYSASVKRAIRKRFPQEWSHEQ